MPIRGERIGDAYIRVYADGSRLSEGLAEDLDKTGEEHSRAYARGWTQGLDDSFNTDAFEGKLDKMLGKMTGRLERLDEVFPQISQAIFDTFEDDNFGKRVSDLLRNDLERGFAELDTDSVIAGIFRNMDKAQQEFFRDSERLREQAEQKEREDRDREFKAFVDDLHAKATAEEKAAAERVRIAAEAEQKLRLDRDKDFDLFNAQQHRLRVAEEEAAKARKEGLRGLSDMFKEVTASLGRLQKGTGRSTDSVRGLRKELVQIGELIDTFDGIEAFDMDAQLRDLNRQLDVTTPRLTRFERQWRGIGDAVGRFSGRGSRNNFLNFIGSMNRNLFNLGALLPKVAGSLVGLVDTFRSAPSAAEGWNRVLTSVIASTATLAAQWPVLIAGMLAMAAAAGLLSAALSGLLAILISLVAVTGFALAGAVAALSGGMLVLASGVGIAVAAWKSLSDEQKKALKEAIEPMTDALKGLGDAAANSLFRRSAVENWAERLTPVLESLEPLVASSAEGIRKAIGRITKDIESAAKGGPLEEFIRAFEVFLPNALNTLTLAGADFVAGFGGIFRAMASPGGILEEFFDWISKIAAEFSEWANSAEGQQELIAFFEDASDAAKDMGDFLKEASDLLVELMDSTRETGGNILTDLAGAAEDLVTWLNSPEGKQAMEDWLAFAEDLATAIGDVSLAVIDLINALDNDFTRNGLFLMFKAIEIAAEGITWIFEDWKRVLAIVFAPLAVALAPLIVAALAAKALLEQIGNLLRNLPSPPQVLAALSEIASDVWGKIQDIASSIRNLPGARDVFSAVLSTVLKVVAGVQNLAGLVRNFPSMGNPFAAAIAAATALYNKIVDIINKIPNINIPRIGGGGPGKSAGGWNGSASDAAGAAGRAFTPSAPPALSSAPSGRQVVIPAINVYSGADDPRAVAQEVVNIAVGAAY